MKNAWRLWGAMFAVAAFGASACSDDSSGGTPAGSGGGDTTATGGMGGAGAGGNDPGTGGQGTGGETVNLRVPHSDLFDCTEATGAVPPLTFERILDGLVRPVFVKGVPGDTERMLVLELDGKIKLIENDEVVGDYLDLSGHTSRGDNAWDERGLLGLEFHPEFQDNGLVYVHHTASTSLAAEFSGSEGDTVIAEYQVTEDSNALDPDSMRIVFTTTQTADNHNGGSIQFGSDGMLYVALGDGGGQRVDAQDIGNVRGSVIRLDVDGRSEGEYSVPSGNLRDTVAAAHPLIWSYGLRNPYRMSFDGCTGDLYIGDVGQGSWEEVNVERRAEGGRNYGWPFMEGTRCFDENGSTVVPSSPDECHMSETPAVSLTLPVESYEWTGGSAVVGGYVYRGAAIPALRGTYFYGDYGSGRIWTFRWDGAEAQDITEHDELSVGGGITSFGQDSSGELYLVRKDETGSGPEHTGEVYRLVASVE